MALSNDLISQFVKVTKDKAPDNSETIVYGTIQESKAPNGLNYVKIDGSDLLTPISSTTVVAANDRVTIMIKNHSAVVTGNLTSPAARSKDTVDVEKLNAQRARIDTLEASNVTIQGELEANSASINLLSAENATIKDTLNANVADINTLKTNEATISGKVTANEAAIQTLQATTITAEDVAATYATIENLNAQKGRIDTLESTYISSTVVAATYATIESLNAQKGRIDTLDANKLSAADIEGLYANIDFSNISKATMGQFYANSGLIQNVVVGDSTITGKLVGVTISGDLIEGNTVKAEKLVIKGMDGLYYKLNTDGVTTEAQQTNQNSLDGSVIKAKSITATKVNVTDLVAFGATIGGFTITDSALYSGVKTSAVNTTRGIYLGKDAQAAIGDGTSYIKYYKDSNGNYKLAISADSIDLTSGTNVQTQIDMLSESVETNSDDLTAYIAATNSKLDDLQGQVDGSIMTWFYEYVPTNSNIPASDWTTTALKNNHLGNLFYDTLTGYCYRWQVQNNTYSWNRITDVDVTKALADAAAAQDTADKKRRVFTATPTTPYDVGDLWAQGTSGELMRCKTAKTSKQSYAAADWEKASKYTDDTKANAAKSAADAAQADANALKTRMTSAETSITQNSEQIALRATKTEVTTAKEAAISTAATDATTKANAVQSNLNNLKIGGRNLVTVKDLSTGYINFEGTSTKEFKARSWVGTVMKTARLKEAFTATKTYSIHCEAEIVALPAYSSNGIYDSRVGLYFYNPSLNTGTMFDFTLVEGTKGTLGAKYVLDKTFTMPQIHDDTCLALYTCLYKNASGAPGTPTTMKMTNLKIEEGDRRTSWTPAPEDIDTNIADAKKAGTDAQADVDALVTRVTAAETSITQNADAIALRATKTEVDAIKTTADSAATQLNTKGLHKAVVDLLDTATYSADKYYPVVGTTIPYTGYHTFEINNQLEANSAPSWSTHSNKGFTCNVSARMIASGWGTTKADMRGWIDLFSYFYCDKMPAYITQMGKSSAPVFYLRGGGKYYIYTDYKCTWTVKTAAYTVSNESVEPTTTPANDSLLVNNWTNNTRLKTAETSIKQNSDAIALRATKDELSALDTRVTSAESSITIMANSIASNVSETTNLGTRTTTLEQTADGLTARMGTAEDDIATAQSTANTAKTNAATAQSTANTAKTNAATAQSTANTAKTNAATAQSTADAAKKTATNFISVDTTNGVLIGNKTSGSWVGTRAQITNSAFNILDSSGTTLASYGTATLIGKTAGNNLYIDNDGLYIRKNGKVLVTVDQYGLKIANKNDSSGSLGSGTTKPALVIGTPTGYHIEMDNNEIMAKSNATTSSHLFLNMEGGNVSINNNADRALMFQDGALYAKNASYYNGDYLGIIDALNDNGNTTFGYGGYINKIGATKIYGNGISLHSNGNIDVEASWINCRSITPSDNATYALGTYGEKGWSNIYLGKGDGKTNALHIISGSSTYTLCGVNSSGQYIFGNNAAVMYYQVKNVSETATGNAFKVTSGNNTAANNTSSVWFFGAADATSRYIGSYLAYNRTYTSAANMVVTANGIFGRSTSSSQRYKKDISVADIDDLKGLYDLPVKKFKYKDDYIAADDELYDKSLYGFVVEDLENVLPCAVQHEKDTDGTLKPEMWNSNIIVPSLLKLIQDLNNRLKVLEKKGE